MANQYYQKDIYKSLEGLLYGLYVYQYLLDTSTLGLLMKTLMQDQFLSPKTKAPTLRMVLYCVFAINLLTMIRHLRRPDPYAVIIDFIGNVSTPSRSKLLFLDVLTMLLQVTEALIVFNFLKVGDGSRSTAATAATSTSASATPETPTDAASTPQSSDQRRHPRHRPRSQNNSTANGAATVVDRRSFEGSSPSRSDSDDDSDHVDDDNDENEDDGDPLAEDYEAILEQETFVLHLRFRDLVSYLFSNQEAVSFTRVPDPRTLSSASANAESTRVQNLPV
ncbi:hypothetical protein BGZ99_007711 [Dissophora globulifera]|uniref:DUF1746 domain-containing protein n=1 Tax=Dissophora globulifera TaxID=979702 RepID=A0A9P6RWF1_9FUNG|nr:hypothetical protein BGZ99_007711 [Dissophora globulifera]